jgi:hypothetical protein
MALYVVLRQALRIYTETSVLKGFYYQKMRAVQELSICITSTAVELNHYELTFKTRKIPPTYIKIICNRDVNYTPLNLNNPLPQQNKNIRMTQESITVQKGKTLQGRHA